ncbi:hypothetical protein DERP_001251 [Dermatophagoides pteronyssinus]|uniref:Uncharacterized protein n=1 Tax=Dermatophagoides pteronyssinus TaxID=6956 RepID=A0ABQ8JEN5_DERPT|nr:hypothetical protein DERP_001251 [Dermatophagoides pteronyssinus]
MGIEAFILSLSNGLNREDFLHAVISFDEDWNLLFATELFLWQDDISNSSSEALMQTAAY